jgi:hypothetical protein
MELRDPAGGQFKCPPFGLGQCFASGLNFVGEDTNSRSVKLYPVEAPGQGYKRAVTAAPHLGNNFGNGGVNSTAIVNTVPRQECQEPFQRRGAEFK